AEERPAAAECAGPYTPESPERDTLRRTAGWRNAMTPTISLLFARAATLGAAIVLVTSLGAPFGAWADPAWEVVQAPRPDNSECDLRGLDVVGPHEAWAVGIYQNENGENRSLT